MVWNRWRVRVMGIRGSVREEAEELEAKTTDSNTTSNKTMFNLNDMFNMTSIIIVMAVIDITIIISIINIHYY